MTRFPHSKEQTVSKILDERRQSLEDEFFHKQSQENLETLRKQLAQQTTKEELRKASGMADDAVLDKLLALGIGAQTVLALSLVPLIHVAWADGKIQDEEREAILQGAQKKGIAKESPAFALLQAWLSQQPRPSLFETWESYIKALRGKLSDKESEQLEAQVIRFARFVAESSGGFLGLGKISGAEEAALGRIEAAFRSISG
jgi:phosphoenolpyruvate synthase/pyruvate phosphate dikinase